MPAEHRAATRTLLPDGIRVRGSGPAIPPTPDIADLSLVDHRVIYLGSLGLEMGIDFSVTNGPMDLHVDLGVAEGHRGNP